MVLLLFMITTSFEGAVESVIEVDSQGATKFQMQAITPGCLVSITPEMVDQEKLDQFIMASDPEDPTNTAGTTSGNNVRRNLQTCSSGNDKVVEVAFGADSSFCSKYGGRNGAIRQINKIVSIADMQYTAPGLCTNILVKFADIQCTPATDRYRASILDNQSGCGNTGFLQAAKELWKNDASLAEKRGDSTQIFTADHFECDDFGCVVGCASFNTVCDVEIAFGVNDMGFTSNDRLQAIVFAHELGHNLVSAHLSLSYVLYFLVALDLTCKISLFSSI
jgi:hypothetical protein